MNSMDAFNFWARNPDFRLFDKEPEPGWCERGALLFEWGDTLLDRLAKDPERTKIGYAKWQLLDRYGESYSSSPCHHQAETNLDNHPCTHQALIKIWQKMREMELVAAIPELQPPPRPQLVQAESEPEVEEVTGILIGEDDELAE